MRRLQYILISVFLLFIMAYLNEMYIFYLGSFETQYSNALIYQSSAKPISQSIEEINQTAMKNGVSIFVKQQSVKSLQSHEIIIYSDPSVMETLGHSGIPAGSYFSLFRGTTRVSYQPLTANSLASPFVSLHFVGEPSQISQVYSLIKQTHPMDELQFAYQSFSPTFVTSVLWLIAIFFFLLIGYFELLIVKKELFIRFINGTTLTSIIRKRIIQDTSVVLLTFAVIYLLFEYVFHLQPAYLLHLSLVFLLLYLILNALLQCSLLFSNYKASLARGRSGQSALRFAYIFKALSIILTTLVVSLSLGLVEDGITHRAQTEFFQAKSDWSFVALYPKGDRFELAEQLSKDFLRDHLMNDQAYLSTFLDYGAQSKRPILLLAGKALDDLSQKVLSLPNNHSRSVYYLVPESDPELLADIHLVSEMYLRNGERYELIQYDETINVMGLNRSGQMNSQLYLNPLIILDLRESFSYFNPILFSQSAMYHLSETDWENALSQKDVDQQISYRTNVLTNFQFQATQKSQQIMIGIGLSILFLILELVVIQTIITYEFLLNATEITIKTTLGYTMPEKFRPQFILSGIILFFAAVGSLLVAHLITKQNLLLLIPGFCLIALFDTIYSVKKIKRTEQDRIISVLKGGIS